MKIPYSMDREREHPELAKRCERAERALSRVASKVKVKLGPAVLAKGTEPGAHCMMGCEEHVSLLFAAARQVGASLAHADYNYSYLGSYAERVGLPERASPRYVGGADDGRQARYAGGAERWANVLSVVEEVDRVERPGRRVCEGGRQGYDIAGRRGGGSATPEIIGAIVGAVVGNEIHGDGAIGEVAGAALGASVARDVKRRGSGGAGCRLVSGGYEDRVVGYRVRYEYEGMVQESVLSRRPVGGRIPVEVQMRVVPLDR